jgi:hypothetical protein
VIGIVVVEKSVNFIKIAIWEKPDKNTMKLM